jgi:hypothetical protein
MVEAIYKHVHKHCGIKYKDERNFNPVTCEQLVRLAPAVRREGGTCVDLVLLFLGCLANVKLWPVYVQVPGAEGIDHALAATWLEEPPEDRVLWLRPSELVRRVKDRSLLVLDCTGFADGFPKREGKLKYDKATRNARDLVLANGCRFALDIRRAWEPGFLH